jgi:hypothetical protein
MNNQPQTLDEWDEAGARAAADAAYSAAVPSSDRFDRAFAMAEAQAQQQQRDYSETAREIGLMPKPPGPSPETAALQDEVKRLRRERDALMDVYGLDEQSLAAEVALHDEVANMDNANQDLEDR